MAVVLTGGGTQRREYGCTWRTHRYDLAGGIYPGLAQTPLLSRPSWVPSGTDPIVHIALWDIALRSLPA